MDVHDEQDLRLILDKPSKFTKSIYKHPEINHRGHREHRDLYKKMVCFGAGAPPTTDH